MKAQNMDIDQNIVYIRLQSIRKEYSHKVERQSCIQELQELNQNPREAINWN